VFKNNETIQYTEFLAATLEIQHRVQEEELAKVFLKLEDSNNKGYISKEVSWLILFEQIVVNIRLH
jgi:Ca2+-binding EF-hand superfamily protein